MEKKMSNEEKIALAKEWLGNRYVAHPVNRIKRLTEPLPEVYDWKPTPVLKGWRPRVAGVKQGE